MKRVVIDCDFPGHELAAETLKAEGNTIIVGSNRADISLMNSIMAFAMLRAAGGSGPASGRALSRLNSQREEEESQRAAKERQKLDTLRKAYFNPNFAAPYGNLTEQDHERLAAAQAKRDRRAAKKASK